MTGIKTNERPGTRAVLRYCRMSAYKAREVLDLIRGQEVARAAAVLRFSDRDAATVVAKVLASAVANAEHNDSVSPEELYVSACYADEGTTIKRWRPRARGRATRIRKRTCHITIIVSRLPDEALLRLRARAEAEAAERRARRVAGGRGRVQRRADARAVEAAEAAESSPVAVSDGEMAAGGARASAATPGPTEPDEMDGVGEPEPAGTDTPAADAGIVDVDEAGVRKAAEVQTEAEEEGEA